jgi:aminomethyltransferase
MTDSAFLTGDGAHLAPDGVPLHFGDLRAEFDAARAGCVLMERSHEGRLTLEGRDRLALVQRISTNEVESLSLGTSVPTIFTSPIGRVIDRVTAANLGDRAVLLTEPGRGEPVRQYLQRNVFFNDQFMVRDLAQKTRQFVLCGPHADDIAAQISAQSDMAAASAVRTEWHGIGLTLVRMKPVSEAQWSILVTRDHAADLWSMMLTRFSGLRPAGSLTYYALRVLAGRPAAGRELTGEYLPLELGLWDEVSFSKGCYTGQEIIARMESRGRLARVMVCLSLESGATAPAPVVLDGRDVGMMTSSVTTPHGESHALAIIKTDAAHASQLLTAGGTRAQVTRLAGIQPAFVTSA